MNHIGDQTRQPSYLALEAHKLHKAFTAGADLEEAQPVKFANDGTVVPLGAADAYYLCIGNTIHAKKEDQEVTVCMRGHAELTVIASANINAGPVKWASYDATAKRNSYAQATDAATTNGHALTDATAGEEITIVVL